MSTDCCCDCCNRCAGCACAGACAEAGELGFQPSRSGLNSLGLRIGDYGRFLSDALRGLSSQDAPALQKLGTRDPSDPLIALLDVWAMTADILTFYRERYGQEGYLRTAVDPRSLRWLASQVGYKPRPGLAATVHLAYLVDPMAEPVRISIGAKAQTVPLAGEQMQTFETLESLYARAEWSEMAPRRTCIPPIDRVDALLRPSIRLAGAATFARPGERILLVFGPQPGMQVVREVAAAKADIVNDFVEITLKPRARLLPEIASKFIKQLDAFSDAMTVELQGRRSPPANARLVAEAGISYLLGADADDALRLVEANVAASRTPWVQKFGSALADVLGEIVSAPYKVRVSIEPTAIDEMLTATVRSPAAQLSSSRLLTRKVASGVDSESARRSELLMALQPRVGERLYSAWRNVSAASAPEATTPEIFVMRASAGAFGATSPLEDHGNEAQALLPIDKTYAFLDSPVEDIQVDSYVLVDTPAYEARARDEGPPLYRRLRLARVRGAQVSTRSDYKVNSKVTRLDLVTLEDPKKRLELADVRSDLNLLRNTLYVVKSERVQLAPEPILGHVAGSTIELDKLYDGLEVGRWIIVTGERTDIEANGTPVRGVQDGELAMIAGVEQLPFANSPGDTRHSVITLQTKLAFRFERATAKIYGNVVKASHGETTTEILGSGDAKTRFQQFVLRRPPLTYLPSASVDGAQSTHVIRANNMLCKEVESLLDAAPDVLAHELAVDGAGAAIVTCGDGIHGARMPSGEENVRATYRAGIGKVGNAKGGQINLLVTRPLGVRGVLNPLAASGGADRDGPERIRANVPLPTLALSPLSRLVSVVDYEYFARRFAGVGQATARKLADGAFECVVVTIAGVDDIPLNAEGDLVQGLLAAYGKFGDPALPVVVLVREVIALFVQARLAIAADADWDAVEAEVRARLWDVFSFERRRFGQPTYLSEITGAIQSVRGVEWVDVEILGGVSELQLRSAEALAQAVASLQDQLTNGLPNEVVPCRNATRAEQPSPDAADSPRFLPAQIAYLLRAAPDTLVLNRA
jgi:hypothetical protein